MKHYYFFLFFLFTGISNAQWVNLDTGINDNLTGVVFLDENGLACGANGLYYTTTGGVGAASWTRFEITNNQAIANIYENTVFTHCYSKPSNTTNTGLVFACGQDTVTQKAVLFMINIPTMAYNLLYVGPNNSKLNKIDFSITYDRYFVVGDDGLLLRFNDSQVNTITTGLTDDLLSVGTASSSILLGTDQKIMRTSIIGFSIGTVNVVPTINATNKDVLFSNSNSSNVYGVGGDSFSYTDLSSTTNFNTRYNQNYYGPLDANGFILYSSNFYIGTNHGIYRCSYATSSFSNVSAEWQVTSLNHHIKDFWKQDGTTDFYAFGNNGVVLKTNGNGGATKPYVRINANGGCYPGGIALSAVTGSANSYSWYINNNLVQTGTNSFTYNFPAVGVYTVTLTVQNSAGEQSTDTKTIYIVNPPQIDKQVTLSDNILCKQEIVQIQIADSEPNVIYTLKMEGQPNSNYGQSQASTGGILTFNTTMIDVTGSYYIDAKNSLANCSRRFTGNFLITVEETKAEFHAGLINAEVNETVEFFENTTDSQNFEWQFSPNASVTSSSLPNPQVSFSAPGLVTTTLHSWSDNDCHDTVVASKPNIFEPDAAAADCFLLVNNSNDPNWPGGYNPDISQTTPTSDGFLLSGTYFNEIFDSTQGVTLNLEGKKGGYLSKYDRNGVIKWTVYNINTAFGNNNDNGVYSTAIDLLGNIYIAGKGNGKFIDNTGRSTDLSATLNLPQYYLIKLNAKGELIWYAQNNSFSFVKMEVDQQNNLIALSNHRDSFTLVQTYFNGALAQEIGQQVVSPQATNLILKVSPSGNIIWDTKVYLYSANRIGLSNLGIDGSNNIYFTMDFDLQAKVYQAGSNTISETITGDGSYGSKIGLVKMSPNGEILWKLRSRTIDANGFPSDLTYANKMIVENDGTIYLTGANDTGYNYFGPLNFTHVFENTNGTTVSTQKGPYFLAKVNTNGICQWIRGSGYTYYGFGENLLKSGNEIHVVGQIFNNTNDGDNCTALFDSTNGNGYNLTINRYDYFVSVYDEAGNLKRLFLNNDGGNVNHFYGFKGFFKGTGDYFYLAKNMGYPSSTTQVYNDFGLTMPAFNGVDGTVVRFTESCAVSKYDATLSNNDLSSNALENLVIVPNPTANEFSITLNDSFESATLEVYDITGKLISEVQFDNVTKVSSSINGQNGLYFVRLKSENNQKWFKLIKQ
ncbi:T9SS type A sorting domain-containing protein [Flavobacterium sp.]|jgi:hypothetical protein|uniref:T9SS type A sorting domain-containing protein n=1 Tax=Flavobacterium sp. TaxID=239 RepID=UPI0037C17BC9